jgi:F-type H+-transporting ATPase subunit epsilon
MNAFAIELSSEEAFERIEGVTSFVASDASGSFGILADREPLVTSLAWGLCWMRTAQGEDYLAVPGGVLYFAENVLRICARRYLRADDPSRIVKELDEQMRAEREVTRNMHDLLHDLDRELLVRLLAP